ncbi:GntR family transcriptional regulator [Actinomadura sp. WMMB 499]|uniref:GntR family transcriptional regulator n=1 Tax=Actinomadura sp. WMMB 499 TaxID=1219491 RepID=UPI001245C8D4|nr:GntR family transcriptional regulator [Actinomadura sp. WMMB 499]QFG21347.1 GntR family transcriptional regulator [Actinomadura sp. WMMB 499]
MDTAGRPGPAGNADGPAPAPAAGSGAGTRNVHEALRRLILEGDLAPGTEISQPELSRRLNVSRTPLREALRLLEQEGLVVSNPHRSVQISSLSLRDLDDLYSARVVDEALAIWLTVPVLRGADFEELERDAELTASGDGAAHRRFHSRLRIGAGQRLADHLERMFDHAERYQRAFLKQEPDREFVAARLDEHRQILDACIARDRRRARDLIVDHIAGTATALMTLERHAPFALPAAVALAKGLLNDD